MKVILTRQLFRYIATMTWVWQQPILFQVGIVNCTCQVEVTMNGVGERAGDTSLEEALNKISLKFLQVVCGKPLVPIVSDRIKYNDKEQEATATGNGPVDSAFKATDIILEKKVMLEEYLHSLIWFRV